MTTGRIGLFVLGVFGMCGCDPLVSGQYLGESLTTVTGTLVFAPTGDEFEMEDQGGEIRLGIVWMNTDGNSLEATSAVWSLQQGVTQASLPARFSLDLYEPPPTSEAVLGWVFAYVDGDASGAFDSAVDRVVGLAQNHGVVYAPQAAGLFPAGFTSVEIEDEGDCGFDDWDEGESEDVVVRLYLDVPVQYVDINCDGSDSEWGLLIDESMRSALQGQ